MGIIAKMEWPTCKLFGVIHDTAHLLVLVAESELDMGTGSTGPSR